MNIENEISMLAFCYCRDIKDRPEVYKYITDSYWAHEYCRCIKDRPVVYKHITESVWADRYCFYIKDRPEVRKYIIGKRNRQWKLLNAENLL